jgi:hypothetical protein
MALTFTAMSALPVREMIGDAPCVRSVQIGHRSEIRLGKGEVEADLLNYLFRPYGITAG